MFKEDYQAAFSKVTASQETHRRILNMTQPKKSKKMGRLASKVLIAAVLVSMLVITASAAEYVHSWFTDYFSAQSEAPLSDGQVEFIEENVQPVSQSQTYDGYTLEVNSVLTDGNNAYIAIGITAPEGVYLDRTVKEGYSPDAPLIWFDGPIVDIDGGYSMTWNMRDDGDGLPNTQNMVLLISNGQAAFTGGKTCKIHIGKIRAEYTNDAFEAELEEKYGYVPKIGQMTKEEEEKLWPMETLAEGDWNFTVTFDEVNVPTVELIQEPVNYTLENRDCVNSTKVLSLKLSPIGAVCIFEPGENAPDSIGGDIIMKDGTEGIFVGGNTSGGANENSSWGMFSVPIDLNNVDRIVFPDGTEIPMPELE